MKHGLRKILRHIAQQDVLAAIHRQRPIRPTTCPVHCRNINPDEFGRHGGFIVVLHAFCIGIGSPDGRRPVWFVGEGLVDEGDRDGAHDADTCGEGFIFVGAVGKVAHVVGRTDEAVGRVFGARDNGTAFSLKVGVDGQLLVE